MRRLLAVSLLLLFSLPLVSPLFAFSANSDANLPACCRRNGKHHCTMNSATQASPNGAPALQSHTIREKCPCTLPNQTPTNLTFHPNDLQAAIYAGILSHPACHAQTEARLRISFDRSRQKRGPPTPVLSLA